MIPAAPVERALAILERVTIDHTRHGRGRTHCELCVAREELVAALEADAGLRPMPPAPTEGSST